jgi:hypothetical protein
VIWKLVYGTEPEFIDHIDGNRANNRLQNLRSVTKSENGRNTKIRADNTSGAHGVFWDRDLGKWRSRVKVDGRDVYLGAFEKLDDAIASRRAAEPKHGYHPNHGRR